MSPLGVAMLIPLLIWAMCADLAGRRIPNLIFVSGMLLGLVAASHQGWNGVTSALGGCTLGTAFLLPFYVARGMAAGDVKLMAMAGTFLGPQATATAAVYVFAAGGVLAIGWWLMHRLGRGDAAMVTAEGENEFRTKRAAGRIRVKDQETDGARTKFPYAVAIATGVGAYLLT